jgi:Mor family transcriptional regulator
MTKYRSRISHRAKTERNREMFELRKAGWLLRELAEKYGVSKMRCSTICRDLYVADGWYISPEWGYRWRPG